MSRMIRFISNQIKWWVTLVLAVFKFFLLTGIFLLPLKGNAQNITLQMCYDSLEQHFPLANQSERLLELYELKIQNLQTQYLPSAYLKARATYQSEVTSIDMAVPGFTPPQVPKDQLTAQVEINQVLYDGGFTKAAKKLVQQQLAGELQKVETDLYQLKKQVNELFYLSLMMQDNHQILELTKESIDARIQVVSSGVAQGVAQASDLDHLQAEKLRLEQQIIGLEMGQKQALDVLEKLSGFSFPPKVQLELPAEAKAAAGSRLRPEQKLFQQQMQVIDASTELGAKKRMPTIGAFATAGYGKPGYDMFNESMHGYYLVGAQMQWHIWDWKINQREQKQNHIQKQVLTDQLDAFNKQQAIGLSEAELRIQKLEQLLEKDLEIIELQKKISDRSARQLENGTITSADYLRDLNEEKQARINWSLHQIQKSQALTDLQYLAGKPVNETQTE
jgi:outer membrane protein TolC